MSSPAEVVIPAAASSASGSVSSSTNSTNRGNRRYRGRGRGGRGGSRGRGRAPSTGSKRGRNNRYSSNFTSSKNSSHFNKDINENSKHQPSQTPLPVPTSSTPPEKSDLCHSLSKQLSRGTLECLVCLTPIHRRKPLWSCKVCYTITHLQCIRRWARNGPVSSPEYRNTADSTNSNSSANIQSRSSTPSACPSCRTKVASSEIAFWCFCRRRKSPTVEPGVLPGSCGETCLKPRGVPGSSCPHRCTLPCHPGPCAPCTQPAIPRKCFCGRESVARKCGEKNEPTSCGGICGAPHNCGHLCNKICHKGECGECDEIVNISCYCGKNSEDLLCGLNGYSCGGICGKKLSCGQHYCQDTCHEGECSPCLLSAEAVTTCPCGKTNLTPDQQSQRTSCTSPIPSCGQICTRELSCLAQHKCNQVCGHSGDCGPCKEEIIADCRCGSSEITVFCGDPPDRLRQLLICGKTCHDRLACRSHNCQTVCCPYKKRRAIQRRGIIKSTSLWNNSLPLSAAQRRKGHSCDQKCSRQLACGIHSCDLSCGHSSSCPPCGILLREPISCFCGASTVQPPVRCGTSPPKCNQPCIIPRPCGHPCPDKCHHGPCPPCVELSRFDCIGRHGESRFVACHIGSKGIKCHRTCGRPLNCGIHACRNQCHSNFPQDCEPSQEDGCSQICGLPRSMCGHGCDSRCHPDRRCPDTPCKEMISVTCPCGRRKEQAMCLRGQQSTLQRSGDTIRLTCDDKCAAEERLRGFASAIGKDDASGSEPETTYAEFLYQFAEFESDRLAFFESNLASIVEGKTKKFISKGLPQLHRLVLHTLAELYNLESESSGRALNRELVVRHRGVGNKPILPKPLLSQANAIREQERKRMRQSTDLRTLIIHVASSTRYSATVNLEARVENELKSHKGCYRVVGKATLSSNHTGLAVEFSTLERAEFVQSTLAGRDDITVEKHLNNSNKITAVSQNLKTMTLRSSSMADSWDDDPGNFGEQGLIRRSEGVNQGRLSEDIPDSWDD